jgi:hypothetical protein
MVLTEKLDVANQYFFFLSGEDIVKDVMPHMVLDHNGSFSLIPSSQIPSFLQQSIERKDQLPVICRQSNNTLCKLFDEISPLFCSCIFF